MTGFLRFSMFLKVFSGFLMSDQNFTEPNFSTRFSPQFNPPFSKNYLTTWARPKPWRFLFLEQNKFTWVRIEGFTMAQEDSSYLVNAMIVPSRPAETQSSWIVHPRSKTILTDISNPSGFVPKDMEEFCQHLHDKYRFSDKERLSKLCKEIYWVRF